MIVYPLTDTFPQSLVSASPWRLVRVAVEAKDSNTLARRCGERVAESSFEEPDLVVE